MRRTGFALALLSAIAMTVVPVAPSFAATPKAPVSANEQLAAHAVRGDVIVLSPAQMNELAVSHPALHSKLAAAHQNGTIPHLTKAEKRLAMGMTQQNVGDIKAGSPAAAWIIVAVVAVVLLILWQPLVCQIFPWALGCTPARAVVRTRG